MRVAKLGLVIKQGLPDEAGCIIIVDRPQTGSGIGTYTGG